MAYKLTVAKSFNVGGKLFNKGESVDYEGILSKEVTLAAAKTGSLSTRTDDDTGTLTMAAGHGITTGARIDIYWTGGARRGVIAGTVAGNSVPFGAGAPDIGLGDVLPSQGTAVTVMVPQEESFTINGTNAGAVLCEVEGARGQIVMAQADNTEEWAITVTDGYGWYNTEQGTTNPITGQTLITKVFFSHADSTASRRVRATVLY
jgi:hypothetical protein